MVLKWNNEQKKALNLRKKGTKHLEGSASAPHAPSQVRHWSVAQSA